jgi:hypothetical protein
MVTTRSGQSSTPGTNIPPTDPTNPNDANGPNDATLIGTTMERTTTMAAGKVHTLVISKIISLCDFPADSTMVRYIDQQGWSELEHVAMIDVDVVKDFFTVRNDGNYEAKPMLIHLRMFKAFLLYFNQKARESYSAMTKDDVIDMSKDAFKEYCGGSTEYVENLRGSVSPAATSTNPRFAVGAPGVVGTTDALTAQEFRRGVKRDKAHYADLKDDKYFSTWNCGFVVTSHMHHTHYVLDESYAPTSDVDIAVFKKMQTFMYAVLEDHLKTDKGKSLVSLFESTRDAQSIYRELKKHALSSTAAQLLGDTLLQYITTARFPGNWRGTSYAFVLLALPVVFLNADAANDTTRIVIRQQQK